MLPADPNIPIKDDEEVISRKLDEKLMELHSLFEVSQTLNSSLKLTAILDNILLTPMGKMLISRGIVLLQYKKNIFRVETLKGLPTSVIGDEIKIECTCSGPQFVDQIDETDNPWIQYFREKSIELVIPIRSSNKILGMIGFGKKISKTKYLQSELNFLNSLSNIASSAIENGLMIIELQEVNRKLDKKVQELNTLFDIGKELNSTLDSDKILNLLSYAIMGEMMINRAMVFTRENDHFELAISKGHRSTADLSEFKNTQELSTFQQISESFQLRDHPQKSPIIDKLYKAGFRVIVPMRIQDETKGILTIGEKINKQDFVQEELEFLYTLGNEAMICLENARLFEETLEKQRIEEELELAREIQQRLLPKSCPKIPGFEIAAMNIPSRQVGGDYYDCISLDSNRTCLAIADVSGKGIPASLLMSNVQAGLHAMIDSGMRLSEIAAKINNMVHRNTGYDRFITFYFGILEHDSRKFGCVNAGHNPPYLFHQDGSFQLLDKGGLILGMMPNIVYQKEEVQLQSGDWIIMFTDGVSEAMNEHDEEFEEHRIEEIVKANLQASAEEMKDALYKAVKNFTKGVPQSDDITMVIVKVLQ
ncbi:SpoIIE family protein phosphatase [candidate division KSB1 bacterium]|nr:SpoIIE family protein phosphatase [candidate division KSB1 bacterium]